MEFNSFLNILHYDPFKRLILNHLWLVDILHLSQVSKEIYTLIQEDHWIQKELLNLILSKSHRRVDFISPYFIPKFNFSSLLQLSARLTQWPYDVFFPPEKVIYHVVEMNDIPGSHGKCFCYQGRILGSNRSIVANDHFPVPIPSKEMESWVETIRPCCSLPFTKTVTDPESLNVFPVLSYIAYFEIEIFDPRPPQNILRSRVDNDPCICIGISRPGFDIQSRMPGWDKNSYGYHGDDGHFFVGNSFHGFPTGDGNSFGPGDKVGFGIVYPTSLNFDEGTLITDPNDFGMVFCTKNGTLKYCHKIQELEFFKFSWFPTIGTDCYFPVEFNFGGNGNPFAFDIVSFEYDVKYNLNIPKSESILTSDSIQLFSLPECNYKYEFQESLNRIKYSLNGFDFHSPVNFIYPPFKDLRLPWRVLDRPPFDGLQFFHDEFSTLSSRQAQGFYERTLPQFQVSEQQLFEILQGARDDPELVSQLLQSLLENGNIEFEDLDEFEEDIDDLESDLSNELLNEDDDVEDDEETGEN